MRTLTLPRVAAASLLVFSGGCSLLTTTECKSDGDCAEGAVCQEGLCVRPLPPWADGGYFIDAATPADSGTVLDAGDDAGNAVDAGVADAGKLDAGELDAGSADAGEHDAGEPADAGSVDAGHADAGADAGHPDAGPAACPDPPDCTIAACLGHLCAPGASCAPSGRCLKNGTSCEIGADGQSACDDPSCLSVSCGRGLGTCTASHACRHRIKTGCLIDIATGVAPCGSEECKGASCGPDQVCTASECAVCGTPCGSPLPGCLTGIDCTTGECSSTCQCLGTPSDFFCGQGCVDLTHNNGSCGACGHACLAATCSSGCCSDPTDCSFALTSICPGNGYQCVDENGARRAAETRCGDGADNDLDSLTDCADQDCDSQPCGNGTCADGFCCNRACNGGCETCAASKGASANGVCTRLGDGATGSGCGGYLCDGQSSSCPTTCAADVDCAAGYRCVGNACRKISGQACDWAGECASGVCTGHSCH